MVAWVCRARHHLIDRRLPVEKDALIQRFLALLLSLISPSPTRISDYLNLVISTRREIRRRWQAKKLTAAWRVIHRNGTFFYSRIVGTHRGGLSESPGRTASSGPPSWKGFFRRTPEAARSRAVLPLQRLECGLSSCRN